MSQPATCDRCLRVSALLTEFRGTLEPWRPLEGFRPVDVTTHLCAECSGHVLCNGHHTMSVTVRITHLRPRSR